MIPVLSHDAVMKLVTPQTAIERVADSFVKFHEGRWHMPPKVYLECPDGDFRAMPARADEYAILKWVTSFPGNPAFNLPTVTGVICLSDATNGSTLMILDGRSVTALRTGAVAAVAAKALAPQDANSVGIIGSGLHGAWAARCLSASGFSQGITYDVRPESADALARELNWKSGSSVDAKNCDVVCCVTPGHEPVITADDLRPGLHLNMLGADGPGKAEATIDAVAQCKLFCDDWSQASHGGELTGALEAGRITREDVTDLGAVLSGDKPGRANPDEITLFDSTGLATQDLAIAICAYEAWQGGNVDAPEIEL